MDQFSQRPLDVIVDDDTSQRTDSRDSLFLAARFRVTAESPVVNVRVRNLSAGGLMAELPVTLAEDTPVQVEVRGIGWIPGKIAWTAVGRCGIAFDHEIDPLRARKPVGKGCKNPSSAKPMLRPR